MSHLWNTGGMPMTRTMATLLAGYTASMKRRYLSPRTIKTRIPVVRTWLEFIGDDWPAATRQDVEQWLETMPHICASTAYNRISHVSEFYRWAMRENLALANPCDLVERPKVPRRLPRPARADLVTMALDDAPVDIAIMLSLMVDGGLRCCEVAGLDWAQVDLDQSKMQFVGKGGRERAVGMPDRLIRTLARSSSTTGPVVGRKLTAGRVSQICSVYLRGDGVGATGHQLRHLYATRMLGQLDGNLMALQQALGHASVSSTQIYALVDPRIALDAARSL